MSALDISRFNNLADLTPAPINPQWIVEGAPVARNLRVAGSSDHSAWTMLWDCTAGKFHWIYSVDETVHVLEGSVTITAGGMTNTLRGATSLSFPPAAWRIGMWKIMSARSPSARNPRPPSSMCRCVLSAA